MLHTMYIYSPMSESMWMQGADDLFHYKIAGRGHKLRGMHCCCGDLGLRGKVEEACKQAE